MAHQTSSGRLVSVTAKLLRLGYAVLLAAAGLVLVLGVLRLILGYHSSIYAPPLAADRGYGIMPGLSAAPLLLVYAWFVRNLQRIAETLAADTPFVPSNAVRLARMGWVAVVLKLIVLSQSLLLHSGPTWARFQPRAEAPGLFVIVTLFILAEVFRQGAAAQGSANLSRH